MAEPYHITVVARLTISVEAGDTRQAEQMALARVRQSSPGLPWTIEHTDVPWGT